MVMRARPPSPDEDFAFRRVEEALNQRFPELPRAAVELAVREERQRFDDSPVREFLPLLVQRAAAERLRKAAIPGPRRPV